MAPYKLIALDIDGTVLTSRHVVAPETRRAVQAAMAHGVRVTLATGRGFPSARAIAAELGLRGTPLVTHDGAYVADPSTGGVLYEQRIPLAVTRQAVALLRGAGLNVNLLYPDVLVSNQRIRHFRWGWLHPRNWDAVANVWREVHDYPHRFAPDLAAYLEQNPLEPPKMYVTGSPPHGRRPCPAHRTPGRPAVDHAGGQQGHGSNAGGRLQGQRAAGARFTAGD
jgi:hydroxymethylpyrimidine pyrophosphatase-like HAD family hydrolase